MLHRTVKRLPRLHRTGAVRTTINRIETGTVEHPHFSTLKKLARALGVEPRKLVG
jgi:DNA-binding Xre family transcriptional regulator